MNGNVDDQGFVAATPAATLVLFRERQGDAPELLVVERSTRMSFAGGAVVFPGGRIDDDDHVIAANPDHLVNPHGLEPDEAAARIAAIRETVEESGIAIGFVETPDHDWITETRERLAARQTFSSIIAASGVLLDLDQLVPFARWRPNFREARAFDTRFYIAKAAPDTAEPKVDSTENVLSFWASAADLLAAADEGKVKIIFPTRRNLERLALFGDFDAAHSHARAIAIETITPWIEDRDGEPHLCIPDHLGYPIASEPIRRAMRGGD
jgi:8-oxo-dGTP pyrophosphatase MutT (NUDIX family)